jgi:uncharacterized protein (TIGR03083 family)
MECLDADLRRLRELAAGDLTQNVPACPGWTLDDLLWHVAEVYLHKAETMRCGAWPDPWPPERAGEPAGVALTRTYAALTEEFATRSMDSAAVTWFEPDQTVRFWVRRMAHESVIHRVDAELAAGVGVQAIADDLAIDGVDEVLKTFLAYSSTVWPEDYDGAVTSSGGETVLLRAGGAAWLVTIGPEVISAETADPAAIADATVTAEPPAVLLWLWRRTDHRTVTIEGDAAVAGKLHDLLRVAMQ